MIDLDNTTLCQIAAIVLFLGYIVIMSLHPIGLLYGQYILHVHKKRDYHNILTDPYGVSILKPIIGFDERLKENLESFFKLDYPKFELLICIGEAENPPSLGVVQELMDQYPSVDARVFIGAANIGINPKINNMINGYDASKYELVWISDSKMIVPPETLLEMTSCFSHVKVGAVHQVPYVTRISSFPDCLELVYFGTTHARTYLSAHFLGQSCVTGMSMILRKAVLEEAGGLKAFSCYLAEDFFFGKTLETGGWVTKLSSFCGLQSNTGRSFSSFKNRMMRWGKLRAPIVPLFVTIMEPISDCLSLGLLLSVFAKLLLSMNMITVFLMHCTVWFLFDMLLLFTVQNGIPSPLWKIILMWFYRELMAFFIILRTHLSSKVVEWGGARYKLKRGGHVIKVV